MKNSAGLLHSQLSLCLLVASPCSPVQAFKDQIRPDQTRSRPEPGLPTTLVAAANLTALAAQEVEHRLPESLARLLGRHACTSQQ